jgi:Virulence-associated protein E/Bifunctional DNA primase/polymerase, N-terminal/Primase C terminal 2 (PriCT-2)
MSEPPTQDVAREGGERNPLVDYALQYAGRGWPVFQLSKSKKPFKGSHGFLDATTDRATIAEWWRRRPGANIGLRTGLGIVVLDVDGPEGLAELQALTALHGLLPATLTARTGNGAHVYFAGEGVKSSARGRLHVRGDGGYVVLPPSVHPNGRRYQWGSVSTVAALPDWLREWMLNGQTQTQKDDHALRRVDLPGYLASLPGRGLAQRALAAIKEGESTWSPQEEKRIRSALKAIPADNYEIWFKIGMILRDLAWVRGDGTDIGLEIWDEWSQTCPAKYPGAGGIEAKWGTFGRSGRGGLGVGSLFAFAQDAGWSGVVADSFTASGGQANGAASAEAVLPAGLSQPTHAIVFRDLDKNGRPKATCANAGIAIQLLGITCEKDLFKQQPLVGGNLIQEYAGNISDDAILAIRRLIHRHFGFDAGQVNTMHAALTECLANQFNPVLDYLDDLQWDRVPRLSGWLSRYLGADDTRLNQEIGRLMLVAAVRRARRPGCKFDQIIVLEGPEGTGKSLAIRILAGDEHFSDKSILALGDREQQEAIRGVWLYEISELAGMRHTDVERIKAFASRQEDKARPAYAHFQVDLPRRCIFIGTTNTDAYLKSDTGNRRFWMVVTRGIDLDGLRSVRDQLWAEAGVIEAGGGPIELDRRLWALAAEEQDKRLEHDAWEEIAGGAVNGKVPIGDISVGELLTGDRFRMDARDIGQVAQTRAARALKRLGFERYLRRNGQALQWRYRRK